MINNRAFKFRIKSPEKHREKFQQFAGAGRWIANRGLEFRTKAYQENGKSLTYFEQNNELIALKEEFPWLQEIHSQVLQQALKNLDRAFKNFFRNINKEKLPAIPDSKRKASAIAFAIPKEFALKDHKLTSLKSAGSNLENPERSRASLKKPPSFKKEMPGTFVFPAK